MQFFISGNRQDLPLSLLIGKYKLKRVLPKSLCEGRNIKKECTSLSPPPNKQYRTKVCMCVGGRVSLRGKGWVLFSRVSDFSNMPSFPVASTQEGE